MRQEMTAFNFGITQSHFNLIRGEMGFVVHFSYQRYYRCIMAQPLTELTKRDLAFKWTPKAETAFQELKREFTGAPILATSTQVGESS
jgi:hypothetical protein